MTVVIPITALSSDRSDRLADMLAETSPAARRARVEAATRPAHPALAPVLPDGRLPRGAAVQVVDDSVLLLALAGGAQEATGWTAIVGMPDLSLAAARQMGVRWSTTLLVDQPGPHWMEVTSTLARACEILIVKPSTDLRPRDVQRLDAVLRESGATLLTPDRWPSAALTLSTSSVEHHGLGQGWGQLTHRTATVRCSGRGRAARARTLRLHLPGPDGLPAPLDTTAVVERWPDTVLRAGTA
ncbi:hypothetical protein [Kitasatospora sp. NPDC059160]|uniref:hypothetical protein n=1 Tax=Kitasatospora sp. NPDC059160 TaxID=3346748 RepID=UPI0036ABE680